MASVRTPLQTATPASSGALEIVVVHTSIQRTLAALRKAGELAEGLAATIRLLVPQIVPHPLQLNHPPVPVAFTARRFRVLTATSKVETRLEVRLCRDVLEMLRLTLPADAIVVLGGQRRWWPTVEGRLAKGLTKLGHQVILSGEF